MASILDRYGIKEVADVTFYDIDGNGNPAAPVLYLDTLKVSTIEQTAETAYATGGKGNVNLIAWDYGKEITVTLEDALFSAKSMAIMFGNGRVDTTATNILKTVEFTATAAAAAGAPTQWEDVRGDMHAIASPSYFDASGSTIEPTAIVEGEKYFVTFEYAAENPGTINISAQNFPGTYYVTGDTFARKEVNGVDEYFQFVIPKAKMTAENTITLEAEGDPTVFSMSLTVLRPADGNMMKLIKYDVPAA